MNIGDDLLTFCTMGIATMSQACKGPQGTVANLNVMPGCELRRPVAVDLQTKGLV